MGRGGEEAEALYEYVKEELESRKIKCMDYISQIPQVFDGVDIYFPSLFIYRRFPSKKYRNEWRRWKLLNDQPIEELSCWRMK